MANISVSNTFANSTTADATQVNQNFTDIINGTSDGTKDFSISALTVGGTLTANGNVSLGNASSDDLSITASLASSLAIKTTATYNVGSSTLGLLSIYLGNSTFTTRLLSGATSSWSMTLPATAGTSRYRLETDGAGATSWQPVRRSPRDAENYGIATSMAASALTISLKGADGNDPSSTNPVDIVFRNATATTGTPVTRTVTSGISVVASSGSTLGHASAVEHFIYVYAIDNAGTVELAMSSVMFEDGSIQSTTAEGGAGAADSIRTLYSTTARSNVAVRLLGRLSSTQATAGTWSTAISLITLNPPAMEPVIVHYTTTGQTVTSGGGADLNYTTKVRDTHNCYSSGTITVPVTGNYIVAAGFESDTGIAAAAITNEVSISILVDSSTKFQDRSCPKTTSSQNKWCQNVCAPIYLTAGQAVKAQAYHETATNMVMNSTAYGNFISLTRVS